MPRAASRGQQANWSARRAWDQTMKQEVGVLRAPGEKAEKKHTTRRVIRQVTERNRSVAGVDELDLKREARLERLELTNAWDAVDSGDVAVDPGAEADSEEERARKRSKRAAARDSPVHMRKPATSLPKVLLSDELAQRHAPSFVGAMVAPSRYPPTPVCSATGLAGRYRDATGLRFHDRRALALLREQVPSWVKGTPVAPYWEAVKAIKYP